MAERQTPSSYRDSGGERRQASSRSGADRQQPASRSGDPRQSASWADDTRQYASQPRDPRQPSRSGDPRQSSRSGEPRQPSRSGEPRQYASQPRDPRQSTPRSGDRDRRQSAPRSGDPRQYAPRSGDRDRRQSSSRRNDVIRCENCGEDYSVTYRRCPFCDERPGRGGAGKRVANTRGGGYGRPVNPVQIAGLVISLALIASAMFIVFRFFGAPIFGDRDEPDSGSQAGSGNPGASQSADPNGGSGSTIPTPAVESIVLSGSELTLDSGTSQPLTANLLPEGVTGDVVWSSSNEEAATVDPAGMVTNVNQGSTTVKVTVTAACGDVTAEATVYCKPAAGTVAPGTRGRIVNAESGLNIRSGPGREYEKVASAANGARVTIQGEENGWYKIIYSGSKTGYVSKDYVSIG